jgi:hypothetical protein
MVASSDWTSTPADVTASRETVFTVLGDAARRSSSRRLATQLLVSGAVAGLILAGAPRFWSLAFLAGCSAAWSAWGLVARVVESRPAHPRLLEALLLAIASLGTALAFAGIVGVGLAIYSGNGRGIKDACGKGSTNERCQAWAHPAPMTAPMTAPIR